jgi:phosphoribosyl 1,2-cyclic phosphodiesterase
MKTFLNCAAQGDVLIRRVDILPLNISRLPPENGVYVVAHSETGHHHVIDATDNVLWYSGDDSMVTYLEVVEATDQAECLLQHLRSYDTHEALIIPPGIYELRRQREHAPEGWRKVQD